MHLHILGICGTFMAGLAVLAKAAGHTVTGCDSNVYPPMSAQLEAQGIQLIEGFSETQLQLGADVYVVGNVITRGNPLLEVILNRGLAVISGPQWLSENILINNWVLAVAGTHGKTTTSAMLAWILDYAGLAPGFLIGGVPKNFGLSARLPAAPSQDAQGLSPFFVIEADEYDCAFFDKRSKFVHYRPRTLILNNLEFDHADIFADLSAIQTQFHHLVRTIPSQGLIICHAGEPSLEQVLARGCWSEVQWFGDNSEWQLGGVDDKQEQLLGTTAATTSTMQKTPDFAILHQGKYLGSVNWTLLGVHNQLNALASIIAARHVGVSVALAMEALRHFENVKRRMEIYGIRNNIFVYDDFAHHPTAILSTLQGLRHKVGNARILAVLEPRSNTMKLGVMKVALADSLRDADRVFCFSAQLGWDVAQALAPLGNKASTHSHLDDMVTTIAQYSRAGDHILVMSNGSFGGVHQKILNALQ